MITDLSFAVNAFFSLLRLFIFFVYHVLQKCENHVIIESLKEVAEIEYR